MSVHYLSLTGLAERAGIQVGTANRYGREGRLPEPDAVTGDGQRAVRGWLPETVDAWLESRPGKGGRPKAN